MAAGSEQGREEEGARSLSEVMAGGDVPSSSPLSSSGRAHRLPAPPGSCLLYQTPSLYSYCSHLHPTSFRLCSLLLILFPEGGFAAGGRDGQGATSEFYDMAFCSLACSIQFGAQCPSSVACRDLLSR